MDLLKTEDVATVTLFDLRLSEGELQAFATALEYALDAFPDQALHAAFAGWPELGDAVETKAFLEMLVQELKTLTRERCRPEMLPERFK